VSRVQIHSIKVYLASKPGGPEPLADGGFDVFDSPDAFLINRARLEHLASLGLPLGGKSVLDVGCGVGHLSSFFAERGCRVMCVDARPGNLGRLKALYPDREIRVADVEVDSLADIGHFDVVFCYGLLYHCENPIAALRNMASCCRELLLLETVISDHPKPILQLVDEPAETKNQAVSGLGCRPSPAFIATALTRLGFSFIYATNNQPDFPDFHFEWKSDCAWQRGGHLLRRILVASRTQLNNPHLTPLEVAPKVAASVPVFRKLAATKPNPVWIDVGAHLGEKTLSIAARNPNMLVYAFEPNLTVAAQLMGRLPNYVVLPMAVAEQDGCSPFYLNRYDAASSLLPFVPEGLQQWVGGEILGVQATLTVPTVRLDTFLNGARIAKVAYLKIDAQGADLAVIRSLGERLRDIERISLEVQTTPIPLYRNGSRKEEVVQLLTQARFELLSCEKQSHDQEENLTFIRRSFGTSVNSAR